MMRAAGPTGERGSPPGPAAAHDTSLGPSLDTSLARAVPGGAMMPTAAGPAFYVDFHLPLEEHWGSLPLATWTRVPRNAWRRWLGRAADGSFSPESVVFVDLETTGLERGTGTYAFLIGIGRVHRDVFRVRQFFMRDYHEEPAVLEGVRRELDGARGVISFNGLSFDWPLLATRAVMNRLPWPQLPQLDILYPARRLWKPVTGDCRLRRLEEDILGVRREGDVPGSLIPQLYFRYVQTGDAAPLAGVFEHNRKDVLTTAALAAYVGSALGAPLAAAPLGRPLPGSELLAIGRLCVERREWAEGIACLQEALRRGLPRTLERQCRKLLATTYRRLGRHEEAAAQWRALAEDGAFGVEPYVELAKYYEHQAKDYGQARRWTLQAMDVVQRRRMLWSAGGRQGFFGRSPYDETIGELSHRLQRLDSKLMRRALAEERAGKQLPLQGTLG